MGEMKTKLYFRFANLFLIIVASRFAFAGIYFQLPVFPFNYFHLLLFLVWFIWRLGINFICTSTCLKLVTKENRLATLKPSLLVLGQLCCTSYLLSYSCNLDHLLVFTGYSGIYILFFRACETITSGRCNRTTHRHNMYIETNTNFQLVRYIQLSSK